MSARVRKGSCRVACTPQPDGTVRDVRRVKALEARLVSSVATLEAAP